MSKETMEMKEFGEILIGRGKGELAANQWLSASSGSTEEMNINFSGVRSFNQSFVSGLLIRLHKEGVDLKKIRHIGISDEVLQKRFDSELDRLKDLYGTRAS